MTFEEAKQFVHATGNLSRPGLARMETLLAQLGNPERTLRFVHVAGTNGKGSTCAMLASVLRCAGCRTGLYISPHLLRINERIQIDGTEISDGDFASMATAIAPAVERMEDKPTEFERITAMAFLYFARQHCDIVVLEVGLGGRLDATNVIAAPEVSVIANIGLEHTEWLGDTLEKIAFEKGGIIKPHCPTVLYHQSESVENTVRELCASRGSELYVSLPCTLSRRALDTQTFSCGSWQDIALSMTGSYQLGNAAVVLRTLEVLRGRGWHIPDAAVRQGMANAAWPARMEILCRSPLVLLDGAHNPNGAEALAQALRELPVQQPFTFVMGVMADKDYTRMLALLAPLARDFIAAQPDYYRALTSAELRAAIGSGFGIPVCDGGSIPNALSLALRLRPEGPICVFGSLYQAGEVRRFFGKE